MKGVALTEEESFDICNMSNVIKQLDQTRDATSVWDPYGVWYSVSTTNWIEEETWQRSGRLFVGFRTGNTVGPKVITVPAPRPFSQKESHFWFYPHVHLNVFLGPAAGRPSNAVWVRPST